jgi:hypothetical protein
MAIQGSYNPHSIRYPLLGDCTALSLFSSASLALQRGEDINFPADQSMWPSSRSWSAS